MTPIADFSGFHAGLVLGAASIVSVGPNNLMLIREGLAGGRSGFMASVICGSYAVLIGASFILAVSVGNFDPSVKIVLSATGLVALSWFAIQSFRSAAARQSAGHADRTRVESTRCCFFRVMRVIWLNPLTYLELLLIPAAIGQSFDHGDDRLQFVAALALMSAICCFGYAYAGRLIAAHLEAKNSLRLFDFASGVLLSGVSLSMGTSLLLKLS